eukprot:431739-Pelagomonas_calceolata.AAC.1
MQGLKHGKAIPQSTGMVCSTHLKVEACSDIELRQKWSKQPYLPVTTGSLKKPTFSFKCLFCTCLLPSAEAHPP